MAEKAVERDVRIAGQLFTLRSSDVKHALRHIDPEPIDRHFVVVGMHRFPPKQVISAVTGLDRADFTSHQARRTLMRLGFTAGRRGATPRATVDSTGAREREDQAARWRPFVGQWVALKDDDVLFAAKTPGELVGWLNEYGQTADTMFRVPEGEQAATGLAPCEIPVSRCA